MRRKIKLLAATSAGELEGNDYLEREHREDINAIGGLQCCTNDGHQSSHIAAHLGPCR